MDFKINTTPGSESTGSTRGNKTQVTQTLSLELVDAAGGVTTLETEFVYDAQDPFAVSATFHTITGPVRWTFGRDLLIGGLYEPTGDGDVHVWPCLDNEAQPVVIIELCSPDGEALVQARTADITAFVEQMTAAVAPGSEAEHLDVDGAIASIFSAEAA